ncbi:hypothetical protein HHL22_10720 [Hymenobacter sp. RP-2-7]|uniref:Uncharacterized protein n=1 Tax=Hymenobacter polaris TaxID=2682546 RepID=A0A7Y0AE71_9BACT|nr:hypothetical protein [Hymenobacter polaris]NML65677.1 hypothetical protein [Hymenobacter polaris]
MSEPTNPLFEEEKAFLERKKLEYERALRGDVAQLKEQTAHVGRVALVGTGLVGSIWLITKALGGRKRRPEDPDAEWPSSYEPSDYGTQRFADFDLADDDDQPDGQWPEADAYFGSSADAHGTVYHSDTEAYDTPGTPDDNLDDNGLGDYPDFPEHSTSYHGTAADTATGDFQSEAYGHPESSLPFDDSRRLPESDDFAETPGSKGAEAQPKRQLGAMLVALAKSDLGKIVLGQAASLGAALVTKALKAKLTSDEPETAKSSDLAAPTGENDGYAHGHPATPQPDAYPADAPAYREPLA